MIPPPAQRTMAERAGATTTEAPGSHAIYVSQPGCRRQPDHPGGTVPAGRELRGLNSSWLAGRTPTSCRPRPRRIAPTRRSRPREQNGSQPAAGVALSLSPRARSPTPWPPVNATRNLLAARCETATDGVEMPVTRAKRVLPTPLGGGLSLPRKGAIKRDRWSSSEPALCGWACASARSSGSVVKLLLLQRAPHAHRPAPSAGITPGQPGPHTIAHPHPSPRSKPRPHPTGHPSLAHQA